jgi:hypothetical protein
METRGNSAGPSNPLLEVVEPGKLGVTVRLKAAVALCPEASLTWTESGYAPGAALVPLMTPLELCNWIPDGRTPLLRFQWYGARPPAAESEAV